jgi:hypothetical protein
VSADVDTWPVRDPRLKDSVENVLQYDVLQYAGVVVQTRVKIEMHRTHAAVGWPCIQFVESGCFNERQINLPSPSVDLICSSTYVPRMMQQLLSCLTAS